MTQEKHQEKKVRLSVDCTEEERMYIKMLATRKHLTISDYLLAQPRKEMPKRSLKCKQSHKPNKETARVLREIERGESLEEYESLDDFWADLGFAENA